MIRLQVWEFMSLVAALFALAFGWQWLFERLTRGAPELPAPREVPVESELDEEDRAWLNAWTRNGKW